MSAPNMKVQPPWRSGALIIVCTMLACPTGAAAEGIGGFAEYNYNLMNTTSNDQHGTTQTKSSSLSQRYNLTLDKNLYPFLRLNASGLIERNSADMDASGTQSTSRSTSISPNVDLAMGSGVLTGGAGFSRHQESSVANGISAPTTYFDTYNARISWKPQDLPSVNLLYSTFNNHDSSDTQDSTSSTVTLSSRFKPVESLDLSYTVNSSALNDKVNGLETQSLSQNLRTSYGEIFFKDRLAVNSSYNISSQSSTVLNHGGAGASTEPLSPFQGLFGITPRFSTPENGKLDARDDVITGGNEITVISVSPGPTGVPAPSTINLGMLFSNSPKVNIVRVLVNVQTPPPALAKQAYPDIAARFGSSMAVYASLDGENWSQVQTTTLSFAYLTSGISNQGSFAFELRFPTISQARYLKVVVTPVNDIPLPQGLLQKMSVTKLETYFHDEVTSSLGKSSKSSSLSGVYDLNLSAKLFNSPAVSYEFGFNLNHSKSNANPLAIRYFINNGLSLSHRFNSKLSASARLSREDSTDPVSSSSANSASLSLTAVPLPTLSSSLNYSGRQGTANGISKVQHSLFLANSAMLYRGVSANLSLGGSMSDDSTGESQKNTLATLGVSLQPHRTLGVGFNLSESHSWSAGGGKQDSTTFSRLGSLSATYNPLESFYLLASYTFNEQTNQAVKTAKSLGGTWAPFRDGTLLLSTGYNESFTTDTKTSAFVQSLRLDIRPGTFLDMSYQLGTSAAVGNSAGPASDFQSFSASLHVGF